MKIRERWRPGLRLNVGDLQALRKAREKARAEKDYDYDKRLRAVELHGHENWTQSSVAKILEVTESCVWGWISNYKKGGIQELRTRKAPGAKSRLSQAQLKKLQKMIEKGPEDCGYDTGVWTAPLVKKLIKEKFHVDYHDGHVRKLLKKLGFSYQYPKKVLSEADPQVQEKWRRKTYEEIKKKLKMITG